MWHPWSEILNGSPATVCNDCFPLLKARATNLFFILCWFPKCVLLKSMSTYIIYDDKCMASPNKRVQSMPFRHVEVFTNGRDYNCMP